MANKFIKSTEELLSLNKILFIFCLILLLIIIIIVGYFGFNCQ